MKIRRHGWIRTIVKSFADLHLTTRPRDYFDALHVVIKIKLCLINYFFTTKVSG